MTKINCNKIINMYNSPKQESLKPNLYIPDDEFIKGDCMTDEQNLKNEKIIKLLNRVNYKNITSYLIDDNYWTDSVNFVGFNKRNRQIDSVSIGISNPAEPQNEVNVISVDEFIDLFTNVTANHIENHPEKEAEYKNSFVELMTYLSKNRIKN